MTKRRALIELGWLSFLVGSIVLLIDGIRERDFVSVSASAIFVVGVIAFMLAEHLPARNSHPGEAPADDLIRAGAVVHQSRRARTDDEWQSTCAQLASANGSVPVRNVSPAGNELGDVAFADSAQNVAPG